MIGKVTGLEAKDIPIINDLLRQLKDSVDSATSIATAATAALPSGIIAMWKGSVATIPSGWHLCDGTEGTPDLTNRFIVCADADVSGVAKTTLTGSATQSGNSNVAAHTHSAPEYGSGLSYAGSGGFLKAGVTGSYGSGSETYPRYYALCYIMKL